MKWSIVCAMMATACGAAESDRAPPTTVEAGDASDDASDDAMTVPNDGGTDADASPDPPPCTCMIKQCQETTCDAATCVYAPAPDGTACVAGGACKSGMCVQSAADDASVER
jgi:hypothetical protein